MKYNSIEWLYNNLKSHFEHDGDLLEAVKMSFEQAKAMHKEEMCQFAFDYNDEYCNNGIVPPVQDYYNEYFNIKEK